MWQEYTEELQKKGLDDWDDDDDVSIHLEMDILECDVKWALEHITMNKANRGDGGPTELLKTIKDDIKCWTKYVKIFGKINSGHRTEKSQASFQSQRRAMTKNIQTTT